MIAALANGTPLDEEAPAAEESAHEEAAPAPEEAAAPSPGSSPEFEAQYKVLKGKYDAEVPRLHTQLRELREELERLKEAKASAPAEKEPGEEKKTPKKVDPSSLADFGPEVQSLAETINELQDEVVNLRAENATLREGLVPVQQQVEQTAKETREQRFLQELATMAPQYAEQNVDPLFLDWLAAQDDYDPDGRTRQEVLTAAAQRGNAKAVARYFNTFAQEHGAGKGSESAPAPQPKTPANVQPGTSRPGTPGSGMPEKRIWTAQSIEKFYRDVQLGHIDAQEATRLERDLFAAQKEGRIR